MTPARLAPGRNHPTPRGAGEGIPYGDGCDTCHAPVMGRSDLELDLSHIAYWLVLKWPLGWFERAWFALLPWAGSVAFGCTCRDKNRAARATSRTPPHA